MENQNNSSLRAQFRKLDQTSAAEESRPNASRSVSFHPTTHEGNIDLVVNMVDNNFTYYAGDLQGVSEQLAVLKKWCLQYFDKLKLIVEMVMTFLQELEHTDEENSMIKRLKELHLELNQSAGFFMEFESKRRSMIFQYSS